MPHVHKTIRGGGCPIRKGLIFFSIQMFQGKSDVKASKHGKVSSQTRKIETSSSSKWNDLMKRWRRTSKVDESLKVCSRNSQKVPPRYDQALKSRNDAPTRKGRCLSKSNHHQKHPHACHKSHTCRSTLKSCKEHLQK